MRFEMVTLSLSPPLVGGYVPRSGTFSLWCNARRL